MKIYTAIRTYFTAFSATATRLILFGMIPLTLALGFLLFLTLGGRVGVYDLVWMRNNFAFWVDSFGLSLLLLLGGAMIYDYAEKHDKREK